jgi:hypothetical protein
VTTNTPETLFELRTRIGTAPASFTVNADLMITASTGLDQSPDGGTLVGFVSEPFDTSCDVSARFALAYDPEIVVGTHAVFTIGNDQRSILLPVTSVRSVLTHEVPNPRAEEAELIREAITTLEGWGDGETTAPGKWTAVRDDPQQLGWFVHADWGVVVTTGYVGNRDSEPTAHAIAGLHRAIRPQAKILRAALTNIETLHDDDWANAVELAQELLGSTVTEL